MKNIKDESLVKLLSLKFYLDSNIFDDKTFVDAFSFLEKASLFSSDDLGRMLCRSVSGKRFKGKRDSRRMIDNFNALIEAEELLTAEFVDDDRIEPDNQNSFGAYHYGEGRSYSSSVSLITTHLDRY